MDTLTRFEFIAEAFRQSTGVMAPGKDASSFGPEELSFEERTKLWERWSRKNRLVVDAFVRAADNILMDPEY